MTRRTSRARRGGLLLLALLLAGSGLGAVAILGLRPSGVAHSSTVRQDPTSPENPARSAAWPVLGAPAEGIPEVVERKLPVREPRPRGAVRVFPSPATEAELELTFVDLTLPFPQATTRRPDFTSDGYGEFYGLAAGRYRGFVHDDRGSSGWLEFEVRPGRIITLEAPLNRPLDRRTLQLLEDDRPFVSDATLVLDFGLLEVLYRWSGRPFSLSGPLASPQAATVRTMPRWPGSRLKQGGRVDLTVGSDRITLRSDSTGTELRCRELDREGQDDALVETAVSLSPMGFRQSGFEPLLALLSREEFSLPPRLHTVLTGAAGPDRDLVVESVKAGPYFCGVGLAHQEGFRCVVWRSLDIGESAQEIALFRPEPGATEVDPKTLRALPRSLLRRFGEDVFTRRWTTSRDLDAHSGPRLDWEILQTERWTARAARCLVRAPAADDRVESSIPAHAVAPETWSSFLPGPEDAPTIEAELKIYQPGLTSSQGLVLEARGSREAWVDGLPLAVPDGRFEFEIRSGEEILQRTEGWHREGSFEISGPSDPPAPGSLLVTQSGGEPAANVRVSIHGEGNGTTSDEGTLDFTKLVESSETGSGWLAHIHDREGQFDHHLILRPGENRFELPPLPERSLTLEGIEQFLGLRFEELGLRSLLLRKRIGGETAFLRHRDHEVFLHPDDVVEIEGQGGSSSIWSWIPAKDERADEEIGEESLRTTARLCLVNASRARNVVLDLPHALISLELAPKVTRVLTLAAPGRIRVAELIVLDEQAPSDWTGFDVEMKEDDVVVVTFP